MEEKKEKGIMDLIDSIPESAWAEIADNMKKENDRKDRYSAYVYAMGPEKRAVVIRKLIEKYNSDSEYRKGYEPRMPLFDVLLDYAERYCQECSYKKNEYFPEEQYDIDGKFVISIIYGQGTVVNVVEVPEDHVIPHVYKEEPVKIYSADNTLICETESQETILDVICQLKKKGIKGWYVEQDDSVFKINGSKVERYACNGTGGIFRMGDRLTDLLRETVLGKE